MTVYLQNTVYSVSRAETGHVHVRPADDDMSLPFAIDCDACAPFLVKDGGTVSPDQVPLTGAQIAEQERIEREGNLAVKQAAAALAESAATLVTSGGSRKRSTTAE